MLVALTRFCSTPNTLRSQVVSKRPVPRTDCASFTPQQPWRGGDFQMSRVPKPVFCYRNVFALVDMI